MKIPYIKIPIADVSAYISSFSFEAKGMILQAVLDFGLYQEWAVLDLPEREQIGYKAVKEIVENEIKSYKKFCREQKNKAKKLWDKKQNHVGAAALPEPVPQLCQAEAKAEAEAEAEAKNKNILTADPAAGPVDNFQTGNFEAPKTALQTATQNAAKTPAEKPKKPLNGLQEFSNLVIAQFEDLETKDQIAVWFKRNCRCLTDILKFCGGDIPVAMETIAVCTERLEKAGLSGGYEAVCRNLSEYYHEAKKRLHGGVYAR